MTPRSEMPENSNTAHKAVQSKFTGSHIDREM